MKAITRIGMDTAKNVFQLHGVDESEAVVLRRQFRRREMITFFEKPRLFLSRLRPVAVPTIGRDCCSLSATKSA